MMTLPRHQAAGSDRGGALVLVVGWSAALMIVSLAIGQLITGQIRTSDENELSYQALAAAEAGIDEYRARLADYSTYNVNTGLPNPTAAMSGWVEIPGGQSEAMYTYSVDDSLARVSGELWISSTGRIGEFTRTLEARLTKDASYNYALLGDAGNIDPNFPGAFEWTDSSNVKFNLSREAKILCAETTDLGTATEQVTSRYWHELGPTSMVRSGNTYVIPAGQTPWHRNSFFCVNRYWDVNDRIVGPMHMNDVWYVTDEMTSTATPDSPGSIDPLTFPYLPGQVFRGPISSSCPGPSSSAPGCPEDHRYIRASDVVPPGANINNNPGQRIDVYKQDEIPASYGQVAWAPAYKPPVDFVGSQPASLKSAARSWGCLLTGPTRIRFFADGTIALTSPDSKFTGSGTSQNPWCVTDKISGSAVVLADNERGTQRVADVYTTPTRMRTVYLDGPKMAENGFNGVFYVQNAPTSTSDPNYWPPPSGTAPSFGNEPSCRAKIRLGSTGSFTDRRFFPWVIPAANATYGDSDLYSGSQLHYGFPMEDTSLRSDGTSDDPWSSRYQDKCDRGTVYVQGRYQGRYTIAAEGDIVLTGDLHDATVAQTTCNVSNGPCDVEGYGLPSASSDNVLGLVPTGYVYIFNPNSTDQGGNAWISNNLQNTIFNFAMLSLSRCLALMNFNSSAGGGLNNLTLVGSLGQRFACDLNGPAGGASGSSAAYTSFTLVYDERLASMAPPPYMADLFQEPWTLEQLSETPIRRDSVARTGIPSVCRALAAGTATTNTATFTDILASAPTGTVLTGARVLTGPRTATTSVLSDTALAFTYPKGVSTTYIDFQVRTPDGLRVGQTLRVQVGGTCS